MLSTNGTVQNSLHDLKEAGYGGKLAVEILLEGYGATAAENRLNGRIGDDGGNRNAAVLEATINLSREAGFSPQKAEGHLIQGFLVGALFAGRKECVLPWG